MYFVRIGTAKDENPTDFSTVLSQRTPQEIIQLQQNIYLYTGTYFETVCKEFKLRNTFLAFIKTLQHLKRLQANFSNLWGKKQMKIMKINEKK